MRSQRLLSCLLLLQGKRRITARELARQLEVSMRTVYRDVEALGASGVPIYMERGPLGGVVLADDYRRALAQFTDDELQALFASGPGPMADFGLTAQTQALQKIAGALPAPAREAIATGRARLFLDHNRWSRGEPPTDVLVQLRAAAHDDRCVRVRYRDRTGSPSDRRLDPLGLVAKAGVWYLIAREEEKGYRTFRIARITGVEILSATFVRPADFDLEAYWNASVVTNERLTGAPFEVVLLAGRSAAATLAYWDPIVLTEDGTLATLRIAFPTREAAVNNVLLVAHDVHIISPAELADEIIARARMAITRFASLA